MRYAGVSGDDRGAVGLCSGRRVDLKDWALMNARQWHEVMQCQHTQEKAKTFELG